MMEKAMEPHSSTLAWKIPWMEEPGRLQSMGLLRVRHDWATSLSCIGEGNGNPLQCSCLENSRDGGAWWAAIYRVAQSRTRLKRLSSSSVSLKWLFILPQLVLLIWSFFIFKKCFFAPDLSCHVWTLSYCVWDLSSPIRDQTRTPCIGSSEA